MSTDEQQARALRAAYIEQARRDIPALLAARPAADDGEDGRHTA